MKPSPEEICDDLLLFFGKVKHGLLRLAEQQGLTLVQLSALYSLYRRGELAMGQIAGVMHCDASNVTGIVDRLVAQGLVTRHESPRDRRTKTLQLTGKGRQAVEKVEQMLPSELGCDKLALQEYQVIHSLIQNLHSAEQV